MKRFRKTILLSSLLLISITTISNAQKLVESVAGIVGNEVVYLSEVEGSVVQAKIQGDRTPLEALRCKIFEELLVQKLFLDQARLDSIVVSESQVEGEVNMRLNDFIVRAGSEKALEEYFKKSMIEIKMDLTKSLLNQQIISEVQGKIAEKITVTPNEVKKYFQSIPKDSLPLVPAKVQLSIIQLDPPSVEENKLAARQKLLELRSRILAGESFSTLAILYSEDIESAKQGGEIGFQMKGNLEKEYADEAWSLNKNVVSRIVETKVGYHIIQVIERKADMLNTRHILIRPKVSPDDAVKTMLKLDSIANKIRRDSITFERAAMLYSSHKDSRINGGKMVKTNPNERENWFALEELNKETYMEVRDMKVGEISSSFKTTDENGNIVFRIVKVNNQMPAHVIDLKDDYQALYNNALQNKRAKTYQQWITRKIGITYIKISDEFKSCSFDNKGWLK
jgi:peptidyl-prolyl cis-trans isomerase SurA